MRHMLLLLPLALAGCGQKQASLPADPIQRAATCGVVAAADARRTSANVDAKLGIEQQGRILHYALLAGTEDGGFDQGRTAAVVNAMPALGEAVTGSKWEGLVPQCAAAYPAAERSAEIALPSDSLASQAGCIALAGFVTSALRASEADYLEAMRAYDGVSRNLDSRLAGTARARGLSQSQMTDARHKAMATLIGLGTPTAVLDQCVKRFGD